MPEETKYFQCVTQEQDMMGVNAPSGNSYVSTKGQFFPVQNETDVQFFSTNRRYKEKSFVEAVKEKVIPVKPKVDPRVLFEKELQSIKVLTKKDVSLLLDSFESKENLLNELQLGRKLPEQLSKKQQTAVIEFYK